MSHAYISGACFFVLTATSWNLSVMIDLIVSRCSSTHGLLLCFILLHISNGSVSASLVGHVLYSVDLLQHEKWLDWDLNPDPSETAPDALPLSYQVLQGIAMWPDSLFHQDLMSAICIPHILLMVHRYIYSRYSPVFPMLYQLYHSLPSSTLNSSSSLYLSVATWVTP